MQLGDPTRLTHFQHEISLKYGKVTRFVLPGSLGFIVTDPALMKKLLQVSLVKVVFAHGKFSPKSSEITRPTLLLGDEVVLL